MNLWRRFRTELSGAWRSLRYDLGRRPPAPDGGPWVDGPDVTYTGMSTFGVPVPADERPPRRPLVAVAVVVLLAVVGAAASHVAVAGGLGSLLRGKPAEPRPYPMAAVPADTSGTPAAGLGHAGGRLATPGAPPAATPPPGTAAGESPDEPAPATAAIPPETPEPPENGTPPVPTPTAPSTETRPSAGPSPSPAPSPSDSPSATPPSSPPDDIPSAPSSGEPGGEGTGATGEALVRRRPGY